MNEQHTPSPWWVEDSGVRDRGGYICHTNPAQRYEGQDERFAKETAERAANKLLIAAAPDLLEAVNAVYINAVNTPGLPGEFSINRATLDKIRAARARALPQGAPK